MYKEKEAEDEGRHWSNTATNYRIPRIVGLTAKKTRKSLIYLLNSFSLPLSLFHLPYTYHLSLVALKFQGVQDPLGLFNLIICCQSRDSDLVLNRGQRFAI